MLEWTGLVLLISLIVIPIVLLFGFAGCNEWYNIKPTELRPQTTFETVLGTDVDQRRRTIVQRIEAARLTASGTAVTITIQRPSTGMLRLLNLFIARPSDITDPARDPYDSAADQTPVLGEALLIAPDPVNPLIELPTITYELNHDLPLLIAFDVGDEGTVPATADTVPADEATAYLGPLPLSPQQPIHEASFSDSNPGEDRQMGYEARPRICLVRRIAVSAT